MTHYNSYKNWTITDKDMMVSNPKSTIDCDTKRAQEYVPQTDGLTVHKYSTLNTTHNGKPVECSSNKPTPVHSIPIAECMAQCHQNDNCIGVSHHENQCTLLGMGVINKNPGYIGGEYRSGATTYIENTSGTDKTCNGMHPTNHWDIRDCDATGKLSNKAVIDNITPLNVRGHMAHVRPQ